MGGRFCSLDQLYQNFSENEVFSSPKLNEEQKQEKGLRRKYCVFSTKLGEDQKKKLKKKVFTAICDHFRQEIRRIF